MFPIYVKDKGFKEPKDPIYYLVTGDGIFLVKKTKFFHSTIKVERVAGLKRHKSGIKLTLPKKVPQKLFQQVVAFFRQVYQKYHSEAVVVLQWSEKDQDYQVSVPEQKVSEVSCDYKLEPGSNQLIRVGTIHSHGGISASHSSVDDKDEQHEDGFHITVGNLATVPTLSCSVVVDGERFGLEPLDLFEPMGEVGVPKEWIKKVRKERARYLTSPHLVDRPIGTVQSTRPAIQDAPRGTYRSSYPPGSYGLQPSSRATSPTSKQGILSTFDEDDGVDEDGQEYEDFSEEDL